MLRQTNKHSFACAASYVATLVALVATPQVYADCLGMQLHAHRGAPSGPENSLTAIKEAYAGQWDAVEIDLQTLRDGEWALHHDAITGRVVKTAVNRPLMQISAAEWSASRMALPSGRVTGEAPALLEDVLAVVAGQPEKSFNAEIKQGASSCAPIERLAATMQTRLPHGNWYLTSALPDVLRCARRVDQNGYLGVIVLDPRNAEATTKNRYAKKFASAARAPTLDRDWLRRTQERVGAPVGVHVATNTLSANPALLHDAAELQMPVFTYDVQSDERHADVLAFMAKKTGLLPSGAIIDGNPSTFCADLKRRL